MTSPQFDLTPYLHQTEGQYLERKSLFDRTTQDAPQPRDRKEVRQQIAKVVAAFANAEGGVAIFGIEDDGALTGHAYPDDAVEAMLNAPHSSLKPPQAPGRRMQHNGVELLVFDVRASETPVMLTGDGYPYRAGESIIAMEEPKIRALKQLGFTESWGSRQSQLSIGELDTALLDDAKARAGLQGISNEEYLVRRRLVDQRGGLYVLKRTAELLFSTAPDHPNAGVRLFRVLGTSREVGVRYGVEELGRLEGPIPVVLRDTFTLVAKHLRRPSRLVGARFRESLEYPQLAWQEAILNAVAHRDYAIEGRSVEVTLFDDRMEVTSPGGLLPDITTEALRRGQRIHQSRNPRLVRCLVDLGFMRDQGEGIPRMFEEMSAQFLPEPVLQSEGNVFTLTLRNTPTLSAEDKGFVERMGDAQLSEHEFRALLEASRHGQIDNATLRSKLGLDTLAASALLRGLRDRGFLVLHQSGASSYWVLEPTYGRQMEGSSVEIEGSSSPIEGSSDEMEGGSARIEAGSRPALVGKPRTNVVRAAILEALNGRWMTTAELAAQLGRDPKSLAEKHLSKMLKEGLIERRYEEASHPQQAYRASQGALFEGGAHRGGKS